MVDSTNKKRFEVKSLDIQSHDTGDIAHVKETTITADAVQKAAQALKNQANTSGFAGKLAEETQAREKLAGDLNAYKTAQATTDKEQVDKIKAEAQAREVLEGFVEGQEKKLQTEVESRVELAQNMQEYAEAKNATDEAQTAMINKHTVEQMIKNGEQDTYAQELDDYTQTGFKTQAEALAALAQTDADLASKLQETNAAHTETVAKTDNVATQFGEFISQLIGVDASNEGQDNPHDL